MKNNILLYAVCALSATLTGCGTDYNDVAAEYLLKNVPNVLCADDQRHAMYVIQDDSKPGPEYHVTKIDLETMQTKELLFATGQPDILEFAIAPESYDSTFVVVTRDKESPYGYLGYVYNTYTNKSDIFIKDHYITAYKDHVVHIFDGRIISNVDVYDVKGNKLGFKTYVGTISDQSVIVELTVSNGGAVSGSYYYEKIGERNRIALTGTIDGEGNVVIEGLNRYHSNNERWEGTMKDGVINATFINLYNDNTCKFTLTEQL